MRFGVVVDHPDDVPRALRDHRLVVVRGRRWDLDAQIDLTARLGTVVAGAPGVPQVRYEDDRQRRRPDHVFFNEQWHADLSWSAQGPTVTLLCALVAGRRAAPTAFVDTISGFERLPDDLRDRASRWQARHHVERSRIERHGRGSPPLPTPRAGLDAPRPGHDPVEPTYVDDPGAAHPVVVAHLPSGRSGVQLGDHAWSIDGHGVDDGRRHVDDLQGRIVAAGDRYVHRWRREDLVVFDGRTVLHRREPTGRATRRRLLRRTVAWPDDGSVQLRS